MATIMAALYSTAGIVMNTYSGHTVVTAGYAYAVERDMLTSGQQIWQGLCFLFLTDI